MTGYRYVKAPVIIHKSLINRTVSFGRKNRRIAKGLFFSGLLLMLSVAWPILSYEIFTAPDMTGEEFLLPVPVSGQEQDFIEKSSSADSDDLTYPQNWFPTAVPKTKRETKITHYTLSIPKFKIENATVEIDGKSLGKSLIQYPGTALPGEIGASVIFGHSILPQFFNPKNYMSIFSLIPTMQLGDEIIIKFDGITYTYRVIDKIEVKPDNISVLEQPYDNEYLRLITCTPPGTYLRRGVVTATLVD